MVKESTSGVYLCISIMKPAVKLNQTVMSTGAVDKYLSRFLSIKLIFLDL